MLKDEKFMMEFICFSVKETISNLEENLRLSNHRSDPSLKAIEDIIKKYGIDKESAWSLYKPVFWHLSDKKIISYDCINWKLNPEYQNPSKSILSRLADEVLKSYRDTLTARLERVYRRELTVTGIKDSI